MEKNKVNFNRLIKAIEMEEAAGKRTVFTMSEWLDDSGDCGTPACIGGHVQLLLGLNDSDVDDVAKFLGIEDLQASRLCYPEGKKSLNYRDHSFMTSRNEAARLLKTFRDSDDCYDPATGIFTIPDDPE